jgi:hypothetical protein
VSGSAPLRRRALRFVVAALLVETLALKLGGYRTFGKVIVRCRRGHLFSTIWIPGVSFKSLRLLWWRFQRCPVGNHWSIVEPVKVSDLTEEQLRAGQEHRDIRLP